MVDPGTFSRKALRFREETERIRILLARPALDRDGLDLLRYRLIITAEIAVDLAQHIIASERLRPPDSLADAFISLGEAEIIEEGLARSMAAFARQRNLLVHEYLIVDDDRVVADARANIDDLDRYVRTLSDRFS